MIPGCMALPTIRSVSLSVKYRSRFLVLLNVRPPGWTRRKDPGPHGGRGARYPGIIIKREADGAAEPRTEPTLVEGGRRYRSAGQRAPASPMARHLDRQTVRAWIQGHREPSTLLHLDADRRQRLTRSRSWHWAVRCPTRKWGTDSG